MLAPRPTCPNCGSQHTVKNGSTHNQKPKHQCQKGHLQFIEILLIKLLTKVL
ncbi:IS1/IS1595 family N-terminal zinc-binding domain-containing protein [Nostoc sp.]|uniref:IS1/IS1595 family N-terminal zinc-binding domain-containing protein n=1 Tax=Nostoc sp. TaxID=1180 RepID=UPI003FA52929